jgi:lipoprotein-releasing system permease protein
MTHKIKQVFLDICIAKKILTNGSNNRFISFIGLSSILGISIGVMALVVVMSVMNGFHFELKKRILDATSHIEIIGGLDDQALYKNLESQIKDTSGILAQAPFVSGEALISKKNLNQGVMVSGVDPAKEILVNQIFNRIILGSDTLSEENHEMIIGKDLARILNLSIGDSVNLLIPKLNFSPIGNYPIIKKFTISGIFDAGIYEYDSKLVLVDIKHAQKLFFKNSKNIYSGIKIQITNPDETIIIENKLKKILTRIQINSYITNWTNRNKNFFAAIQMEKRVMSIILTLIIAVAAFNLIASLTMSVQDRKKDISIMRSIGFSKTQIIRIFLFQGFIIGIIGSALGLLLGVMIASNIDTIVPFIEGLFNTEFLSKDIYYIDKLPSIILLADILFVVMVSIILSVIATIYPSYIASKYNPAEVLKNE